MLQLKIVFDSHCPESVIVQAFKRLDFLLNFLEQFENCSSIKCLNFLLHFLEQFEFDQTSLSFII